MSGYQDFSNFAVVLAQLFVIAFVIERALDFVFDYHFIRKHLGHRKGWKAIVSLVVSASICIWHKVDIIAAVFGESSWHPAGIALTSLFLAGGSGAVMTLFHNVLGISQSLRRDRREAEALKLSLEKSALESRQLQVREAYLRSLELSSVGENMSMGSRGGDVSAAQTLLKRYGYLNDNVRIDGTYGRETELAVRRFQEFNGLACDGELGAITRDTMTRSRCGVPDILVDGAASRTCKWETQIVRYKLHWGPSGFEDSRCRELIRQAFDAWTDACGLRFEEVLPSEQAEIDIRWELPKYEPKLVPFSVYAYGFGPCHPYRKGQIIFDDSETWIDDDAAMPSDGMLIRLNAIHEIGHAIGLQHSDGPEDIMYLEPQKLGIRGLSSADVSTVRAIYGTI